MLYIYPILDVKNGSQELLKGQNEKDLMSDQGQNLCR